MFTATKKVIGNLTKCYSVALIKDRGGVRLLCAAEKQDPCFMFDTEGNQVDTLWEGPGGVMTLEQHPASDETIVMATRKFYSPNDSADAAIVYYRRGTDGAWEGEVLCDLPFVHRFGVLVRGGVHYLVACTLKSAHAFKNDWTCPGRVYVAELPEDITAYNKDNQLQLTPLISGLYHNHGFAKVTGNPAIEGEEAGCVYCLVGTDNGVFKVVPPAVRGGDWETALLIEDATSDMLFEDFDGDGKRELLTLAPFHGTKLAVRKATGQADAPWANAFCKNSLCALTVPEHEIQTTYETVWNYPEPMPFLHAVYTAELGGKKAAVIGNREGKKELLAVYYDADLDTYVTEVLDAGAGPANVLYFEDNGKDKLLAANRETDEIALYEVKTNA